jgi:hypothetical protein
VKLEALLRPRRLTLQGAAWVSLLLAAAAVPVAIYRPQLLDSALALACAVALAGYLSRGRWSDALLLAVPVFAADWVEVDFGSHVLAMLTLPIYALTRRARFAALAGGVLFALLLAGIALKKRFAGTVLSWQDVEFFLLQFGDNVGVLATQPTLLLYATLALCVCLAVCVAGWRWDRAGRAPGYLPQHLVVVVASVLLAGWSGSAVLREARQLAARGAWNVGESLAFQPLSGFFSTAWIKPRWTLPAADTTPFRQHATQRPTATGRPGGPADIVLQESQFNPATLAGCPARLCELPVFRPQRDTVANGPLQVPVFGGGTWLTEFALATGVPHQVFGPAGDFAPFNVAPGTRRSFVRSLHAAGYRTAAVYPVRGGMMNARTAYAGYGFDRFYDAADLGMAGKFDTTDAEMHAAARRVLAEERKHGQPVFLFVVTIFNHGEHGVHMERVPPELVQSAAAAFADRDEAANVADYVWRTRQFEAALVETRSAVLEAGRPAVLAWFGDHQPPFARALGLRERVRSVPTAAGSVPPRYQTWYQVSSNLGSPADPAPRGLDVVFLPGLLAQLAAVRMDDWLTANVSAREQCGGLLQACRRAGVREAYLSYLWQDLKAFDLP